ncbi:MAG: hypothetical protein SRB2_02136 [Desulfobacteraceae bacterium Eth-SRB2]|nr:MAG: hypothetical protein SRB2_02136 [Desulfobacteraceae bacterium Eth-SRB2]
MDQKKREEISVKIIGNWKADEKLRAKYKDNFGLYAIQTEIDEEWKDVAIQNEFGDYDTFTAWKLNEHRSTILGNRTIQ